ncbi:protein maintenance of meristems [Tanacetum coccineum]
MMVLGGFSVITSHVESLQDRDALLNLDKAYKKLTRGPSKKARFHAWMTEFKNNQNVHEHEAFIALWLSKYLFPSVKHTVLPETFELAIFLARGRKMALAPAVLATLYKDLHLLQNAILDLQQGKREVLQHVFSPMHHVQVWALERFPRIRPDGMCNIRDDETRLARWAKSVNKSTDYAALESGTCEEHFVWRPYVKDTKHFIARTIYKEDARVEKIDNEEMDSFARCVRVSKLVWLDISQQYFPHRVSKQFGYNQDIPADVLHLESNEDAWADYATSMENEYIYLPSRQFEGHVTVRYEEWWKSEPIAIHHDNRVPLPPKIKRRRRMILVYSFSSFSVFFSCYCVIVVALNSHPVL